jgi:hypothetical protein
VNEVKEWSPRERSKTSPASCTTPVKQMLPCATQRNSNCACPYPTQCNIQGSDPRGATEKWRARNLGIVALGGVREESEVACVNPWQTQPPLLSLVFVNVLSLLVIPSTPPLCQHIMIVHTPVQDV